MRNVILALVACAVSAVRAAETWETLLVQAAAPQTVELGAAPSPWKLEVVLTGLRPRAELSIAGQYPQLVGLVGDTATTYLSVNGWENSRDLFLTGGGTGTAAGTPVGTVNGNNDVGNGELWAPTSGVVTLLFEDDGTHLSVSQNGHVFLRTDKDAARETLSAVQVGGGLSQLGGGMIASVRLCTGTSFVGPAPDGYGKLVFAEEFNGRQLDEAKWGKVPVLTGGAPDWRKYTSDRADLVAVSNGCLVLTGVRNDDKSADARDYLCGQVQTSGKFSFTYGVVELRAKFENQSGAWPAMWMMPQSATHGGWPRSGEIDITERLNSDAKVYQTAHFGEVDTTSGATAAIRNEQFNVYRLEWTPDRIVWSVNGVQTHVYSDPGEGYRKWPFDHPFYLILSQQLEGGWVGKVTDASTLPVRMYVDYVRVWQKHEDVRENAYLWLDAQREGTVQTNALGEVERWSSVHALGRTAHTYALANDAPSGPTNANGLVSFGTTAANRDLAFDRATDLRTLYLVAKTEPGANAFVLGDSLEYPFHRGANGEYWSGAHALAAVRTGVTKWNGSRVADPTATPMPSGLGVLEVHAAGAFTASQICYDRLGNGATPRRGGKDVAELLLFKDALGYADRLKVRQYLMDKWLPGEAHADWSITDDWVLRQTGDHSSGLSLAAACSDGEGTYEFSNLTLVGAGGEGAYTLRVCTNDVVTLKHGSFADDRSSVSLQVVGGTVYLGAADNASVWYGDGTSSLDLRAGTVVARATGTAQSGSAAGLLVGWGGALRTFDVSGGLLDVSRSSLNFWSATTEVRVSGAGVVRAKGVFAGQSKGTVRLASGGAFEIGALGWQADSCALTLAGGTLRGFEAGAAVHNALVLENGTASALGSADGTPLVVDGALSGAGTLTLAAGAFVTLPSRGALTWVCETAVEGVAVTDGVLDLGTQRGAALRGLSGTGTLRVRLTEAERKAGAAAVPLFRWTGAEAYAGDVTVVPDVGGPAKLAYRDDGFLVFVPTVSVASATVSGETDWSSLVWRDDFGQVVAGASITNCSAHLTAEPGAVLRVSPSDDLRTLAMSVSGTLTVRGENLSYLPWSAVETGGTLVYGGTYDLGTGTASFSASGAYVFATNLVLSAGRLHLGNTYDVVQSFTQLGGRVTVTDGGDGTSTGTAPSIFAHWGSGRPSRVAYGLLAGTFAATNAVRYALYFGADGQPELTVGGGASSALMVLSGLAQGTDGSARTQPGALTVATNGTLRLGAGGLYLRNANTQAVLAGGTLQFTDDASVSVAHGGRLQVTRDSVLDVAAGATVTFAHPWTGAGHLALAGGGSVALTLEVPSRSVRDGTRVAVARVAADFPTDRCSVSLTCAEYDGARTAAALAVEDGVLYATPEADASVWVQTDIAGDNVNLRATGVQTQSSFYRGKDDYQPLIGLRLDQLPSAALWRVQAYLSDGTDPDMVADVKLYRTSTPYFASPTEVTSAKAAVTKPSASSRFINFDFWNGGAGSGALPSVSVGQYLWIGVRLRASAPAHAELDARLSALHVNGQVAYLSNADPKGAGEVYPYAFHIVPYWRLNGWTLSALTRQHFACYTEIIPFYITVGSDGSVGHGWNGEQFTDEKFRAAIDRIKALRAGKDVKLIVGVGFSQGNLPGVCANAATRQAAARNLAAFVRKFGLDGVDFDWEYPTEKAHWEGWCNLVSDLKPLLFAQGGGKLVSVAVTGWRTQQGGGTLGAGDAVKGLYQQCDFVSMMSYDGSEQAGHATLGLMNNDFTRAATYGGIPNYKICGGQAFYTNHLPCDGSQNGYNWVVSNYPQYVDSVDKFTASDGRIYTYNSVATIQAKGARCRAIGGGAMIWANETDVSLAHAKSATRALFSQLWPTRVAGDGTLEVTQAADWPALASVGQATLAGDLTLDAGVLRPPVFGGTLDGRGHTVTVTDDAALAGSLTGTLKNLTVRWADGFCTVYDANGQASRSGGYPNCGAAPLVLTNAYRVALASSTLATAGAMVNIPAGWAGDLVSFVDGDYRIWLRAEPEASGSLRLGLGWTDTDGVTRRGGYGAGLSVAPGPHAVTVTCSATKGQGTRVYVDGEWVDEATGLNFSTVRFTGVEFGAGGLGLYACDALSGARGAFVYPFYASYPAFNVVRMHADDDPLELTDLAAYASNATATVFASVRTSAEAELGPVLDVTLRQGGNAYVAEAYRSGATEVKVAWRPSGGDTRTYAAQTVSACETEGYRVWHLSYDAAGGTYVDINGRAVASSSGTRWSGSCVQGLALGLRSGCEVHERTWQPGQARAADADEPLGGLVAPPAWFGTVSRSAQDYLYGALGKSVETYELPAVTVNGKPAATNDALLAMRYFGGAPDEARDYSLVLAAPVVSSDRVSLGLRGDSPVHAALQLYAGETLAPDAWRVVAELPAGAAARSFSFPLDAGGRFYQVRAADAVTARAASGMPIVASGTVQANLGTLTLDGEPTFAVTLGGAGVADGLAGYLSVGGVAYVAHVDAASGRLVFAFGASAPASGAVAELTLVVPEGTTNGDIRVVSPAVGGLAYPEALVTAVVADTPAADGLADAGFPSEYRIPSLVSDGKGEVLCCYDVRYGATDLGYYYNGSASGGIDVGETRSGDGGRTFASPRLGVDVPNFRNRHGVWPCGNDKSAMAKTNDLGDVSMLYDPVTETYWMMGITGGGLSTVRYNPDTVDVVLYTRRKGPEAVWTEWRNASAAPGDAPGSRSVKWTILSQLGGATNATGSVGSGFLQGPGHGMVTSIGKDGKMPAGTLVFPVQYFFGGSTVGAVYSTDHGTNWVATARSTAGTNPQENCVMELDDGSWYMTAKAGSRPGTGRINFFRTTDYRTWNYVGEHYPVPCQQGSCLRLGEGPDGRGRYVLCHTLHPDTATRAQVALVFGTDTTASDDEALAEAGVSWDFAHPLMLHYGNTGFKGYNSLCLVDPQTLGVLYEANGHIYFVRIGLAGRL